MYIHVNKSHILLYPILLGGGTSIGPYWSPPPHPHPQRQQMSPARGQKKKKQLMSFYWLYEKESLGNQ